MSIVDQIEMNLVDPGKRLRFVVAQPHNLEDRVERRRKAVPGEHVPLLFGDVLKELRNLLIGS